MNLFPRFYGARLLGVRRFILIVLSVMAGTASITFAIIAANDFHKAILTTAAGSRAHIVVHLPITRVEEVGDLRARILKVTGVAQCEPALRLEGNFQFEVKSRNGELEFADVMSTEVVGYEFTTAKRKNLPVAFDKVYSKANRKSSPGMQPLDIMCNPEAGDVGRAILSDTLAFRLFRRPRPSGNNFDVILPLSADGAGGHITFHARTAGAYLVNALGPSTERRDPTYVRLEELQKALGLEGRVNCLDVRLLDPGAAGAVGKLIAGQVPEAMKVVSWTEPEADSLAFLSLLNFGVLSAVAIVGGTAAFSLCAILFMVVADKLKEIAVVSALGATPRLIQTMFVLIGARIGLLGSALGVCGGIVLSWAQSSRQAELMSNFYNRPDDWIVIPWLQVSVAGLSVALLCSLAALFPCIWSMRMDPARLLAQD